MCIGTMVVSETDMRWSTNHRGYWTDYVIGYKYLVENLDNGGLGRSGYKDYVPVMTLQLHRWNDDSRD